jgi:uncharacterized repeat protein (TIGR01451 family)
MKSSICITNRKQTASFSIVSLMLAIAPLWLMLAAANTSQAQTPSSPADWTQFHRDNMQRWNPYETVLGVSNVGSLRLKWKSPNGVGIGVSMQPSPAVVNGVVYVGSYGGNVSALNASTGARLWTYTTLDDVISSPAVANGVVYIPSTDGNVYALNAGTGALLWSYNIRPSGFSSPAVANGVVYVGSDDGNVYALNASTGAKLWSYATGQSVDSSPAVANGVVYIGSGDGTVYALNATTGAKLWSYSTGSSVESSPAVANGVVYVVSDALYALNASTGAKLWSYAAGGSSSPAVANGVVYVGGGDGNFYALNASTGAKLWSYATGIAAELGPVVSSPAVVDGVLYISGGISLTGDGNVYAFELASSNSADLFLRIQPSPTPVHQGDLLTYAFPVWNLGPGDAVHEVLTTQVPAGTTFDSIRISGTPGLGTCTTPPYGGTGQIVCHENSSMAPNTTWTVRLTVKVTAPSGTVITENAATMADTPDPNPANNTATASVNVLGNADLFLRVQPSTTTVHQGDLLTYAFPVWNLGPDNAVQEVLNTQVPAGTTFDYVRISGTPGLGTCTTPPYQGTGQIVCHENGVMAPNTTWTMRLTVKVTAPAGTVITESAATMADSTDPNLANNTATVSIKVQ